MATPISIDVAGELDNQWIKDGMPDDGLRIVGYRVSGNGTISYLEVPGRVDAPCYCYNNGYYRHIAGPTLAEWQEAQYERQERQDAADLYAWASGR